MKYTLERSYQILERTPSVLKTLLSGLDDGWVMNNEGPDTFSPYDVIGHLIHGEKTDWTARTKIILEFALSKPFVPWDRFAQYEEVMEKDGCKPMDFTGRVMKGFVFVDADVLTTKKKLEYWVKLALEYNKIAKASKKPARRTGGKTVKKKK